MIKSKLISFYKKHHENISSISIAISGTAIIWILLWIWDYIIASLIGASTPSFKITHILSDIWAIIFTYHRFDLVAISFLYVIVLVPIPFAIIYRYTVAKYLAFISVWFYGSLSFGNLLYSIVYSNFNFSIFYPFQILYDGYYKTYYDWLILAICYLMSSALVLAGILKYIWIKEKKDKKSESGKFGTAKQADIHYLHKHNFIIPYSKAQPNWIAIAKKNKKYVGIEKLSRYRHTVVIAPTRQGKSVAVAIPRILDSIDSCFILDLKSELFQTTYEESIRKGKIPVALDPYKILDRYGDFPSENIIRHMNPLNPKFIDTSDKFILDEYIDSLTSSLLSDTKYENDHFQEAADAMIGALLEDYILNNKTLVTLFDDFNASSYEEIIETLHAIYDETESRRALSARGLLQKVDKKEGGGFLSTTFRSFKYLSSTVWASFFDKDGFDFGELIDKKVDLYFIIPTRMAKQHSRVVRLLLNMFMINFELADPVKLADRKFEVFIDEAGQIKCTKEIENILEIYGEKGMCLTTFWQSLKQITNNYERDDLITDADIIHVFSITNPQTIKWIQERAGQQTIIKESESKNKSSSNNSDFKALTSGTCSLTQSRILNHLKSIDIKGLNEDI